MLLSKVIFLIAISMAFCGLPRFNLTKWEFTVAGRFDNKSYPAKVPSTVHLDLLENKLIDDPFVKSNAAQANWIHSANVEYKTTFQLPESWKSYAAIELIMEGIDTYADVILNGESIAKTDNAFVKYTISVKASQLKFGGSDNTLVVKFTQSPAKDN